MAEQKRRPFQYSLASLVLAAIGVGAAGGWIFFMVLEYGQYVRAKEGTDTARSNLVMTSSIVYVYVNNVNRDGKYPGCLDDLQYPAPFLNGFFPAFTNCRCAESDVGFYTVSGLTMRDAGAMWLYDELPEKARGLGRLVLRIKPDGYCEPELLSEAEFQRALAKTLAIPGTRVVANNRRECQLAQEVKHWVTYHEDRIQFGVEDTTQRHNTHYYYDVWPYGIWRDQLRLIHWPFLWAKSTPFLIIAFVAFSILGYRWRRARKKGEPV
ncbi:MAG: hypothetical protein ABSE73_06165 [Planctomycetota bacterium]